MSYESSDVFYSTREPIYVSRQEAINWLFKDDPWQSAGALLLRGCDVGTVQPGKYFTLERHEK